eukprot:732132-Amorphochlora_amoeboformis.AAC.1
MPTSATVTTNALFQKVTSYLSEYLGRGPRDESLEESVHRHQPATHRCVCCPIDAPINTPIDFPVDTTVIGD